MASSFRIRQAVPADGSFLGDMVVEAANWRPGAARPRHEIIGGADHRRYVSGWMRPGDAGFVAEDAFGAPVGAAWYRLSLSVERGNFAATLYRSEAFAVVRSGLGRDTMVKRLR